MGTTTTHRGPMGNMRRNISLMWKLLAIIVIIQASGISAKQIQNDLTFDDTFDIDQFEDAASSTKLRSARDLDEQAFIEDELQPVDDSESSNGGSWLMQSVKRVRRELGRLFGGDEKKLVADKKHAKGALKAERQRKRQAKQAEKQKRKALAASVARNNKAKSRLNKRHSYDDVEGSGDENETDNEGYDKWQTLFTVSEPWQEEYRMGKGHRVFDDLERQIQSAFEDFASQNYNDDDEFELQPTLMRVNRVPSDTFKIYCIVQLDLPERWSDFGDRLRQYLVSYKRFGDLGADADSNYYFRRVKDSTEDVPIDAGSEDESHHHYGVDEVEASGEGYVTETSPVYTRGPEVGCRGDTTFTCPESGRVICEEQLCDGEEQCPDGEDELNCGTDGDGEDGGDNEYEPEQCQDNEFRCDNRCLPKEYQCNGVHECIDNTDELNCPEKAKVEGICAAIITKLNGLGPPQREVAEWKKVWAELKATIATGGGPFTQEPLSPIEELVDEAINIRTAALPPGKCIGLDEDNSKICNNDKKPTTSKGQINKRAPETINDLLREQISNQKKLITELEILNHRQNKIADSLEKLSNIAKDFFICITSDK